MWQWRHRLAILLFLLVCLDLNWGEVDWASPIAEYLYMSSLIIMPHAYDCIAQQSSSEWLLEASPRAIQGQQKRMQGNLPEDDGSNTEIPTEQGPQLPDQPRAPVSVNEESGHGGTNAEEDDERDSQAASSGAGGLCCPARPSRPGNVSRGPRQGVELSGVERLPWFTACWQDQSKA